MEEDLQEIRIKSIVDKQDSNKQCGFCPSVFDVNDESRWDVYFCYLTDNKDASSFMICNGCRTDAFELDGDKNVYMQYADGDEWYKVDDYVPLNYY